MMTQIHNLITPINSNENIGVIILKICVITTEHIVFAASLQQLTHA